MRTCPVSRIPRIPRRGGSTWMCTSTTLILGNPVPYLDVRSDVSHNSAAVYAGVEMVSAARPHKGAAGLHYGNNIALDASGSYQVVAIIAASPLTGTDRDQRCAFRLDLDGQASR